MHPLFLYQAWGHCKTALCLDQLDDDDDDDYDDEDGRFIYNVIWSVEFFVIWSFHKHFGAPHPRRGLHLGHSNILTLLQKYILRMKTITRRKEARRVICHGIPYAISSSCYVFGLSSQISKSVELGI